MRIKSISKVKDLNGKKILLRVDFNIPMDGNKVKNDYKIRASLLTIFFLLRKKCRIVIISHITASSTLKPVALRLQKILNEEYSHIFKGKVTFIDNCLGFKVEEEISKMNNGDIIVLENVRKHKEEVDNSKRFAKRLSRLADIYVNNAFAVSHRAHASVNAINQYIESHGGLQLERELASLDRVLNAKKPFVVIIGGIKLETKMPLLLKLYKEADHILLGGGVANTFLKFLGNETGISQMALTDAKLIKKKLANSKQKKILTPIDVVIRTYDKHKGEIITVKPIKDISAYDKILDIGPETIKLYSNIIKKAQTIVWNGPMGKFEEDTFKHGTIALGRIIAARSKGPAFGVVGGGETIEALHKTKMSEHVDWISTGGGAMLSYLSGKDMPGLKNITK
ncbi:phosphoglycerate kinase [Patescibacteria group bacterium]|nr:phosphoglycerate kinase [Patescibacteria group bacterium]